MNPVRSRKFRGDTILVFYERHGDSVALFVWHDRHDRVDTDDDDADFINDFPRLDHNAPLLASDKALGFEQDDRRTQEQRLT